jgi:hypothetical protein
VREPHAAITSTAAAVPPERMNAVYLPTSRRIQHTKRRELAPPPWDAR